ncbi:hypothetical protein Tco_1234730 [Tanacetum coccineum]
MEKKDTLSSCSDSEIQQMQLIQDKTKESCMVSFQRLHSHLKCLLNNDLKGSRTEDGFKRAFTTLFCQDLETFTGTMFLNMDQLQKQLDNNEFQEIGSMASFKVLETQFQMFIKSKIYLNDEYIVMTRNYFLEYTRLDIPEFRDTLIQNMDYVKKSIEKRALHKMEYDSRVNERLMQTTEEKVDSSKAMDTSLVIIESNGTESQKQDTSSRPGNDAHINDADIRPIYNEEHGWRKTFASSTTKVESEPPNGSNADIPNQCESEQALNVSAGTLLSTADQASVFMEMMSVHISSGLVLHQMTSDHNRSELGIQDHSNEQSSSKLVPKVVVRLGINPMIQPEPEDLPKDNPKLEIAVLSAKTYLLFSQLLKEFDREDLENLWKLVKAKHGDTRPEEGYERVLWGLSSSPDDEEDTRSSQEYMDSLEEEYQARALLAKSKRFFKKGTQRFSSAKATDQTECHKCDRMGYFARDCYRLGMISVTNYKPQG